jgi:hypothetical protein
MKHREQTPAFMEYASDMLANRNFRMMSFAERGLLMTLRLECWVNGTVPSEPAALAELLGRPIAEIEQTLTKRVLEFFTKSGTELRAPDLERYRSEQAIRRARQSEGARKTNAKRFGERDAKRTLLRGKEMSGNERKREEASTGGINTSADEWLDAYQQNEDSFGHGSLK